MADAQRENERIEKKILRKRKRQKTAWIIIAIIIAALLVMRICEIDFSNAGSGSSSSGSSAAGFPFELYSGADVSFGELGNNIYVLSDTSYTVINPSSGNALQNFEHGYSNPLTKSSGNYSIIYDQGGYSYRLVSSKEVVYDTKSDNAILCADVSSSGNVAVCTTSDDAKSTVTVYNKSSDKKFSFNVTYGYVTSVAIDSRGSRIAFAALNSENAKLKTVVFTMNIDDSSPRAQFEYVSSDIYDLKFSSTDLFVVGSDFISVISSLKNENKVFESGNVNTVSYCFNPSGALVYVYSDYLGSENNVAVIKSSGTVSNVAKISAQVKDVSASSSRISVLTDDSVFTYKSSNGELKNTVSVDDSYTYIQHISSKIFTKRQTMVELLNEKQG
ncbi:MAG: DUF5711 family protein [Clostridiales bacterium]|nr:DUF5711 family protein [Clostridiales bacterium]